MIITMVQIKGAVSAGGLRAAGANGSFLFQAMRGLIEGVNGKEVRGPYFRGG